MNFITKGYSISVNVMVKFTPIRTMYYMLLSASWRVWNTATSAEISIQCCCSTGVLSKEVRTRNATPPRTSLAEGPRENPISFVCSCLNYLLPEERSDCVIGKPRHPSIFKLPHVHTTRSKTSFINYALDHYI